MQEDFQRRVAEAQSSQSSNGTPPEFDIRLWTQSAGGKSKGRVFGLGSQAAYVAPDGAGGWVGESTSSTQGSTCSSSVPATDRSDVYERQLADLHMQMANAMRQIEQLRAERAQSQPAPTTDPTPRHTGVISTYMKHNYFIIIILGLNCYTYVIYISIQVDDIDLGADVDADADAEHDLGGIAPDDIPSDDGAGDDDGTGGGNVTQPDFNLDDLMRD